MKQNDSRCVLFLVQSTCKEMSSDVIDCTVVRELSFARLRSHKCHRPVRTDLNDRIPWYIPDALSRAPVSYMYVRCEYTQLDNALVTLYMTKTEV